MSKILIVDDSYVSRLRVSQIFRTDGHNIIQAENGEEGISAYLREKPNLVFLDITMPGMNGVEALRIILSHDPAAKVIMLSAQEEQNLIEECLTIGAVFYFSKAGINFSELKRVSSVYL